MPRTLDPSIGPDATHNTVDTTEVDYREVEDKQHHTHDVDNDPNELYVVRRLGGPLFRLRSVPRSSSCEEADAGWSRD